MLTEFQLPDPGASMALAISAGPGGNLYYSGCDSNYQPVVARVNVAGDVTATYPLPATGHCIDDYRAITAGPDGNLWVARSCGLGRPDCDDAILRVTLGGAVTVYLQ